MTAKTRHDSGVSTEVSFPLAVGWPKIVAIDSRTGKRHVLLDRPNLVVNNFYAQTKYLLAGQGLEKRVLARVSFGENGAAPAPSNTAITNPYRVNISDYSYPTSYSILVRATLPRTAANGKSIREMGLEFSNVAPNLATRVAFDTMTKNPYFAWEISWEIAFGGCSQGACNAVRGQLCHLLAGDSEGRYVSEMQFGTGTLAPHPDQTVLQMPIVPTKSISTVTYPDTYTARFSGYLLENEGNGFPISEVGLLTGDGTLVARTVFSGRNKDEEHFLGVEIDVKTRT